MIDFCFSYIYLTTFITLLSGIHDSDQSVVAFCCQMLMLDHKTVYLTIVPGNKCPIKLNMFHGSLVLLSASNGVSFWKCKSNSVLLGIVLSPISLQLYLPLGSPIKWLKLHIFMYIRIYTYTENVRNNISIEISLRIPAVIS